MGNTYEVWAWEKGEDGELHYREAYAGEELVDAMSIMFQLKKDGCGCIKFYWRGSDTG